MGQPNVMSQLKIPRYGNGFVIQLRQNRVVRSSSLDPGNSDGHLIRRLAFPTLHRGPHDNKRPTVDRDSNVMELETLDEDGDDGFHLGERKSIADTRARATEETHPNDGGVNDRLAGREV
jgi:hypothetical protein